MTNEKINFKPLHKALASLQKALQQPVDEYVRDAVIQRFEYTYELLWKTLKRYLNLEYEIAEPLSVKDLFREAARLELIDNLDAWFNYHTARNLTSHTYDDDTAQKTYAAAQLFAVDAIKLLTRLEK